MNKIKVNKCIDFLNEDKENIGRDCRNVIYDILNGYNIYRRINVGNSFGNCDVTLNMKNYLGKVVHAYSNDRMLCIKHDDQIIHSKTIQYFIRNIQFSPDGKYLLINELFEVILYDIDGWRRYLSHNARYDYVMISENSKYIIMYNNASNLVFGLEIINIETKNVCFNMRCLRPLYGKLVSMNIIDVKVSPDSNYVAICLISGIEEHKYVTDYYKDIWMISLKDNAAVSKLPIPCNKDDGCQDKINFDRNNNIRMIEPGNNVIKISVWNPFNHKIRDICKLKNGVFRGMDKLSQFGKWLCIRKEYDAIIIIDSRNMKVVGIVNPKFTIHDYFMRDDILVLKENSSFEYMNVDSVLPYLM